MKRAIWLAVAVAVVAVAGTIFASRHRAFEARTWQPMASPGALSAAHASLDHECRSCHEANHGVSAEKCIACHAGQSALTGRQPTAFHADVPSCGECHVEHGGRSHRPIQMDHVALVAIALRSDAAPAGAGWLRRELAGFRAVRADAAGDRQELLLRLDCSGCHGNADKHQKLFGRGCGSCHGTDGWRIAGYRHPSPRSRDCSQCHQAPPSHYMEHFAMISQKIAGQEQARVDQCWRCHQTTAWNDIRGVGFYKHH